MPKSVLCYDVDKDLTSFWNSVFTQSCSPNKETDSRRRVKHFILFGVGNISQDVFILVLHLQSLTLSILNQRP